MVKAKEAVEGKAEHKSFHHGSKEHKLSHQENKEPKSGIHEKLAHKLDRTEELNRILIENFVNLQKVLTNMSSKFDLLAVNMSSLLQLFEMSARSFADKQPVKDLEKDKEFLDKLNTLMEQNKTIAKGLTLMEEKIRERLYGQPQTAPAETPMPSTERFSAGIMPPSPLLKKLPRF